MGDKATLTGPVWYLALALALTPALMAPGFWFDPDETVKMVNLAPPIAYAVAPATYRAYIAYLGHKNLTIALASALVVLTGERRLIGSLFVGYSYMVIADALLPKLVFGIKLAAGQAQMAPVAVLCAAFGAYLLRTSSAAKKPATLTGRLFYASLALALLPLAFVSGFLLHPEDTVAMVNLAPPAAYRVSPATYRAYIAYIGHKDSIVAFSSALVVLSRNRRLVGLAMLVFTYMALGDALMPYFFKSRLAGDQIPFQVSVVALLSLYSAYLLAGGSSSSAKSKSIKAR